MIAMFPEYKDRTCGGHYRTGCYVTCDTEYSQITVGYTHSLSVGHAMAELPHARLDRVLRAKHARIDHETADRVELAKLLARESQPVRHKRIHRASAKG
jgi:hypothetical protein